MTNEERIANRIVELGRMAEWLTKQLVNHGLCPSDTDCTDEDISRCKPRSALKCWINHARAEVRSRGE